VDLVDGPVAVTCTPASDAPFPVGRTMVTCVARDAHGNQATRRFNVSVRIGTPRLSIRALSITPRTAGGQVTATLQISNLGDGNAINVVIDRVTLRALTGSGSMSVITAIPIDVGSIAVGQSRTIAITVTVPATVLRFSITEGGRYLKANGVEYRFSVGQANRL
jgi:hypothetical protein